MKILVASDHAGFELKNEIKAFLVENDFSVEDMGPFKYDKEDDYPDFIISTALKVAENPQENIAIIFGKSGQGEAMVANRFPGVHATVYYGGENEIVSLAREHNDSNVLSIGAGFVSPEEAKDAVMIWLKTPFSGEERHERRLEKADNIE